MTLALVPLAVLVAVAYGVQTASGFGSGLILVTIGAHFLDLPTLLALILPLSIFQTGWIAFRHRAHIHRPVLFRRILPLMGLGMALGYVLAFRLAEQSILKQLLGAFVVLLAGRELWLLRTGTPPKAGSAATSIAAIFGAGIMHGLYATGGPLLIYGLGRENLERARFRATITVVWFILNIVLVGTFAMEGRYTPDTLAQVGVLGIGLPVGIAAGEKVFSGVSERTFKWGIYGLLALAGIPLMLG